MLKMARRAAFLLLFIGGVSGAVIYYTVDMHTLRYLAAFRWETIAVMLCFLATGLLLDGTRLLHLVRAAGERITLLDALQVVFGNYFLALVTPGATGGAVAQVLFLQHAGVPSATAAVIVLVRTAMSILFLFFCLPVVFYFDRGLLSWLPPNMGRAMILLSTAAVLGIIFLWRTRLFDRLVVAVARRFPHRLSRRILRVYCGVRTAMRLFWHSPQAMLRVWVESGLSLLALYSIVPSLAMGMGVAVDWRQMLGRMIFLNLILYFAPTPGGSGIAEGGFIMLFSGLIPSGILGIIAVMWRLVSEYIPFMIGAVFTVKVFGYRFLESAGKK